MIYNLEEYEPYIKGILKKIPLCYYAQLIKCLTKKYDMDDELAFQVLLSIQRRGYIYLSTDGWAMSKGMYQRITDDRLNKNVNIYEECCRLGPMTKIIESKGLNGDEIDCFWLAADMIPASEDFIIGTIPWHIAFDVHNTSDNLGRLYQITKIPKEKEFARCELLKGLPKVEDRAMQSVIRRVAIIDNPEHSWMIPRIGFSHICALDPDSPHGYRVIEKRTGKEAWEE